VCDRQAQDGDIPIADLLGVSPCCLRRGKTRFEVWLHRSSELGQLREISLAIEERTVIINGGSTRGPIEDLTSSAALRYGKAALAFMPATICRLLPAPQGRIFAARDDSRASIPRCLRYLATT
jgi:hypothetical protein